jgi:hypothetical protein
MTDAVSRQAVIDAVRSVPPGTTCRGDAIIAAINALPPIESVYTLVKAVRELRQAIRISGVKRNTPQLYRAVMSFDAALSAFDKE